MKNALVIGIGVFMLFFFAGCTQSSGSPEAEEDGDQVLIEGEGEGVTLEIWVHADINRQYYEMVAEKFQETYPEHSVEILLL